MEVAFCRGRTVKAAPIASFPGNGGADFTLQMAPAGRWNHLEPPVR